MSMFSPSFLQGLFVPTKKSTYPYEIYAEPSDEAHINARIDIFCARCQVSVCLRAEKDGDCLSIKVDPVQAESDDSIRLSSDRPPTKTWSIMSFKLLPEFDCEIAGCDVAPDGVWSISVSLTPTKVARPHKQMDEIVKAAMVVVDHSISTIIKLRATSHELPFDEDSLYLALPRRSGNSLIAAAIVGKYQGLLVVRNHVQKKEAIRNGASENDVIELTSHIAKNICGRAYKVVVFDISRVLTEGQMMAVMEIIDYFTRSIFIFVGSVPETDSVSIFKLVGDMRKYNSSPRFELGWRRMAGALADVGIAVHRNNSYGKVVFTHEGKEYRIDDTTMEIRRCAPNSCRDEACVILEEHLKKH